MSSGLYSGQPGLSLGTGLYRTVSGLWSGASGLAMAFGGAGMPLSLNFLTMTAYTLDPRITFSRGSQAMVTDATGKLTYAPNNLLTNSESFEATAWAKTNATVTANTVAAPDGSLTADKLAEDASAAGRWVQITSGVTISAGIVYTASVYAKAAERNFLQITLPSAAFGSGQYANFNLASGAVGSVAGGTAAISSVGNGWYRCSFTVTATAAGTAGPAFLPINADTASRLPVYAGTAGSGVFVWGAQLEAVTYQTTPSPYVSTTPKNLLGYTQEFDNAAWTKGNAAAYPFDPATATQGPELVTNGGFDSDTVWGKGTGWTISAGVASKTAGTAAAISQDMGLVNGKTYLITLTVNVSAGILSIRLNDITPDMASITTSGSYTFRITANGPAANGFAYFRGDAAFAGTIDNISVKELSGGLITAPDGSLTADNFVCTAGLALHETYQNVTLVSGTPYVVSVYAKKNTQDFIQLRHYTAAGGSTRFANFDLQNGTVGTVGADASATITSVGNGWYRCSLLASPTANSSGFNLLCVPASTSGSAATFNAAGTEAIYLWGAQLSNSASVDPYVYNPVAAPSSTAYYPPRFDYDPVTLAPKGLLVEEQRTNLLLRSEEFDNAVWAKQEATIVANAAVAPDGTMTADKLIESTGTGFGHRIFSSNGTQQIRTGSIYVKAAERTKIGFGSQGGLIINAKFDLASGSFIGSSNGVISQNVGNGWWRFSYSSNDAVSPLGPYVYILNNNAQEIYAGDGTSGIYIWGAQLEAGAFATSYIPTGASQVTRTADVALMQGANFSNWYNQSEGTFVADGSTFGNASPCIIAAQSTSTDCMFIRRGAGAPSFRIQTSVGVQGDFGTIAASGKTAAAYRTDDFAVSSNGGSVSTDTAGSVPVVNKLDIGSFVGGLFLNGHIRSIQYYNTRLANTVLQGITA